MTGYDELLEARVRQLKEIDERLEWIASGLPAPVRAQPYSPSDILITRANLAGLRRDLADMIRTAEAEHTAF